MGRSADAGSRSARIGCSSDDIGPMIQSVIEDLTAELRRRSSNFVTVVGELDTLFAENSRAILMEAAEEIRALRSPADPVSVEYSIDVPSGPELSRTGVARAEQSRHPAESLMAAEVLYDVALPIVARWARNANGLLLGDIAIAKVLHHAIWRRFPAGAIGYVEFVVARLRSAESASRLKISRELHDRVAQNVAAASIRLSDIEVDIGEPRLRRSVEAVDRALKMALRDIQDIAVALRPAIGDTSLYGALQDYISDLAPTHTHIGVVENGVSRPIPRPDLEECYAIVVEAIRNAGRHALNAETIEVLLNWSESELEVVISDDGPGFEITSIASDRLGLKTMRERAILLNADVVVAPGQGGTSVTLRLPLSKVNLSD